MDNILGYASGVGASDTGCADGPSYLFDKYLFKNPQLFAPEINLDKYAAIEKACTMLAQKTFSLVQNQQFFHVIGGEHSCAIGTWSGVSAALGEHHDLGLIWIDAHMDSHTPETSLSGNIHGMPVATLLGYGDERLTYILGNFPKIKPENVCMIGIRSYESAELDLLKKLNVTIYYMKEVQERGLDAIFQEARDKVTKNTTAYGISLDLDGLDPMDAPGVGTPENHGIFADDLIKVLKRYAVSDKEHKKLAGFEIAEFNPHRDIHHKTEKLILKLLDTL